MYVVLRTVTGAVLAAFIAAVLAAILLVIVGLHQLIWRAGRLRGGDSRRRMPMPAPGDVSTALPVVAEPA